MKRIAIIGFGFCGRLAFHHLLKRQDISFLIFDKAGKDFLGPAFSEFSPHYILNVTAGKMSAFSNKPQDFCDFVKNNYAQYKINEDDYAPRYVYGKYINQISQEDFVTAEKKNIPYNFVNAEVLTIKKQAESFVITTSEASYCADEILMATSFKQTELGYNISSSGFIKALWSRDYYNFHNKEIDAKRLVIIGSGLTAVDVLLGLNKKQFKGEIIV